MLPDLGRVEFSLRLLLTLLAAFWLLVAALASPAAAQPAPVQAVRFTAFAIRPLTDVAFAPRPGAPLQRVQFRSTARSPRYDYRGPAPLRFVDPATQAVVAEVTLPAGVGSVLLLFSPIDPASGDSSAGRLRYRVAVLDDGVGRHGPGGLAMINLSGLALSGTVNDRQVSLRPGLNPTLAVGRSARMRFTTTRNQRTYQSYVGTAALGSGERALLVLFPPYYPGSFEVQARLLIDKAGGSDPVPR